MATGKKIIAPFVLVNNLPIIGSFQSNPFSVQYYDRAVLEMVFTGTLTGTVSVQASNDYVPPNQTLLVMVQPPNWVDIPLVGLNPQAFLNPLIGVDQGYMIDFTETGQPWLRVSVTFTGGVGNLTAVITGKES